ncbi:amino acid ABC transporter permease [Elioraea sp.]|uniref:amino acid ABC transporter permease n=1 Tax=Elioraea sp. TaxID=2185103 RepID=UPI003F71EF01
MLTAARSSPPSGAMSWSGWLRANFFGSVTSSILTIMLVAAAIMTVPPLVRWAVLDSIWITEDPAACRAASGACWAVVAEKHRVMLFGTYPYDQHWRGVLAMAIVVALIAVLTVRRFHSAALLVLWPLGLAAALAVQFGGFLGLPHVPTALWGGLPLTLFIFVGTVIGGMPLAVLLALGRQSRLPVIRRLSIGYIETIRGIPLVNILFVAALLFPLFMPAGVNFDKLLRAQVGMIMFFAAYTAESVRGGLQAIPRGQFEAADSLGVSAWERTVRIVLPQALRIVIPPIVNDVIRAFKNTSVLLIIGLLDVLGGTMAALEDPHWSRFYVEAYLFIALLYFAFCFTMSQYSQKLEAELKTGRNY